MRRLWRRLCADPGSPPVLGAPRIEIYARLARATKQRASRRDWRNRTIRKGGEAAEIELTYSATGDISQAKPALGRLIVCIIQVIEINFADRQITILPMGSNRQLKVTYQDAMEDLLLENRKS